MKFWSWLLAMVVGVCMTVCIGCGGDDDEAATDTTTGGATTGGTTGTTTTGGTTGTTTTGGTTGTTTVPDVILATLESSMPAGDTWADSGYIAPADGVMNLRVTWTTQFPAGTEFPLSINLGGVVLNGNASSPAEMRAGASAGSSWGFTLNNNNASGSVLVNIRLVWTAD